MTSRRPRDEAAGGLPCGFEALCGAAVEYPPGATLFRQGDAPRMVFLVNRGVVKHLRCGPDGREAILTLRKVNSLVGSASAIAADVHVTTAVVLVASTLRPVDAAALRRAVESDHEISQFVLYLHAREIREQMIRRADMMLPAIWRLGRLLGDFVRFGLVTELRGETRLDVPLSHEEMGQMIGVTRGHVSRLLNELEDRGIIVRRQEWIIIPPDSSLERDDLPPQDLRRLVRTSPFPELCCKSGPPHD